MTTLVVVLTLLSLCVVAACRARWWGARSTWLTLHTVFGAVGGVVWLVFLAAPSSSPLGSSLTGVVGLGCWWLVSVAGLALIPADRIRPGRRASEPLAGRLLWALMHVLVLGAWLVITWAYAVRKV